ncbi:MAG: ribonuclease HII [Ruminococcaceae bacterium]|nr:ribonuclease HII [Oscillospiraceae bacterium]
MNTELNMAEFDRQFLKDGVEYLAGVDEAGRGPLAGAVFAAAVILPNGFYMEEINDSKKLTEKKREALFPIIQERALAYAIASVDERVIDEINILNATMLAMRQAIEGLSIKPDMILVDGNQNRTLPEPNLCVKGGDAKSQSIAAASILAKVARDRYCKEVLAGIYPEYGFDKHKGYGSKEHCEVLRRLGPSPVHRMTFLTKILAKDAE